MITNIENISGVTHITWILNNICTNSCVYCPPELRNGKNHHYDWSHAESFIEELFTRYTKIHVTISGGEPTLSPFLLDLVSKFHNAGHTIGMNSNGVRTARYYEELAPMLSYMCMSWHPSGDNDQFIEKALASAKGCLTKIRVMMDARYWDQCIQFLDQLKKIKELGWEPVRITKWYDNTEAESSYNYTSEQNNWFNNAPTEGAKFFRLKYPLLSKNQLISHAWLNTGKKIKYIDATQMINQQNNKFQGWKCAQGTESLAIRHTGKIDAANCEQNKKIGHIQDSKNIKWITSLVVCEMPSCDCSSDILLTKYKDNAMTPKTKFISWIKQI
jgi:MoaA/NifB/PqqE/SkfB family radical SAM enzyme